MSSLKSQTKIQWPVKSKCPKCKTILGPSKFSKNQPVCRTCNKKSAYEWQYKNPERYGYRILTNGCKRFKKDLQISYEEYLEIIKDRTCHYCERPLWERGRQKSEFGHGLDRIDNSKGYIKGNLLPCCGECNTGRGVNYTIEEWKVAVTAIMKFRKKSGAHIN